MATTRTHNPASFIVTGSPRSGLGTIYHALEQHPALQVICKDEKPHFTDEDLYQSGNPSNRTYDQHYVDYGDDFLHGEVSAAYLTHPFAISRIQRYNPDIKLVIILRNPAMRTYSQWQQATAQGLENRPFTDVLTKTVQSKEDLTHYQSQSLYGYHVSHVLQYLDPHQLLFIKSDDFKEDPEVAMYQLCQFIGVPYLDLDLTAQNIGSYTDSLTDEMYDQVMQTYSSDVKSLESLVGWDCSTWTAQKSKEAKPRVTA